MNISNKNVKENQSFEQKFFRKYYKNYINLAYLYLVFQKCNGCMHIYIKITIYLRKLQSIEKKIDSNQISGWERA